MGLSQTVAPTIEPVTLAEAKGHLRVDIADDDALITSLITAAREKCEHYTQRQLLQATYLYTYLPSYYWDGVILLPKPPLVSVGSVKAVDSAGSTTTLTANTDYRVYTAEIPGKIQFINIPSYDETRFDALQVTFTAGHGTVTSQVPYGIKTAMLWLIDAWYRNREEINAPVNSSVERLLDVYRVFDVGA